MEVDFLGDILAIITMLTAAGGIGSMLVSLLKMLGWISDGNSGKVVKIVDLVIFAAVAVVYFLNVQVDWSTVNAYIILASYVIGLVVQIGASEVTYKALKGTPVIGYSFSDKEVG